MIPAPFVYFVQPAGGGPIKIGCSRNPAGRLSTLMAWSPYPLVMLASAPGNRLTEAQLHRRFAHLRQHGEWFAPADDLLACVAEVARDGLIHGNIGVGINADKPLRQRGVMAKVRTAFGMSGRDFAALVGVSRASLSNWNLSSPHPLVIITLLEAATQRGIALSPADFFEEEPAA